MLGWRYCGGFSAHNQVRVGAEDRDGRMKLAGYMIRAPLNVPGNGALARRNDPAVGSKHGG